MKKIFLVGLATLFACFVMAQSPVSGRVDSLKKNNRSAVMRAGAGMQMNKEAMAKARAKRISDKYKLNDEQTKKLEVLCQKNMMKLPMKQQPSRSSFARGGKKCGQQCRCAMKQCKMKKNNGKNREVRINALVALVKEYSPSSKFEETAVRQRIMGIMSMQDKKACDSSACKMGKTMKCPMQKGKKQGNKARKFNQGGAKVRTQQMREVRQEFEKGLQEIMTKKQFEAYKKDRQDNKDKAQKKEIKGKQNKKDGQKKN